MPHSLSHNQDVVQETHTPFLYFFFALQQDNFQRMSDQVLSRLDQMNERVDELEGQVSRLVKESGVELPPEHSEKS